MKYFVFISLNVFVLNFLCIDASAQKVDNISSGGSVQEKLDLARGNAMVFPNPSEGPIELTFYSEVSGKYGITVFDSEGNGLLSIDGVSSMGTNHISLDLSGYGPGRYPISITGQGIVAKVLVIIK